MSTTAQPPRLRNRLLSALLSGEYRPLAPTLERVELALGEVIYEPGTPIRYVYFPETAVISTLATLEDGKTVEVGIIGNEGMVGIQVFLGAVAAPDRAVVQVEGSAMRMASEVLREELRSVSPLQQLLLRYTQSVLTSISQSAVCSQHHAVDQRLARWLLMMQDYVESDTLRFTHELISMMIGSRRAGVTEAATQLQRAGVIRYSRGRITILDRKGLEAASCECYRVIRDEFERLHADIAMLLSDDSP